MGLFSFFRSLARGTADRVVGLASGSTPARWLDSKSAFNLVIVIGIVALGFSGWFVYHRVIVTTSLHPTAATNNKNAPAASATLDKLKTKDTDGDGLSDYDELYAFHTSPYLKDTDGDGLNDKQEIDAGTDPNCPKGQVCEGFHLLTSVVDANGQLTPEFLRQALQLAGVPQTTLDKTDDTTLLSLYQQVVNSQSPTNTNSSTLNANTNPSGTTTNSSSSATNINLTNTVLSNINGSSPAALTQIQNLSASEIRQLLIQNGIDSASLSQVDDATLQQIFQQAVQSSQ